MENLAGYIWDTKVVEEYLKNLTLAPGTVDYYSVQKADGSSSGITSGDVPYSPSFPDAESGMKCTVCNCLLTDRKDVLVHYRLDWHKINFKRSIRGQKTLTEEEFSEVLSDVSSISGSETETEEEEEVTHLRKSPHIYFTNDRQEVLSLYRTLFQTRKSDGLPENVCELASKISLKLHWIIILIGGGHFAAGVFTGSHCVIHKTFHSYTVRAKQGGSQSSKDSQSGGSHPRSAGASLRRYNERSHMQHVHELLEAWKDHLSSCDLIFIRGSPSSLSALFGGKLPILDKNDPRIRNIPFITRRPTFSEVKRVHHKLCEVLLHGPLEEFRHDKKHSHPTAEVKKERKHSLSKKKDLHKVDRSKMNTVAMVESAQEEEDAHTLSEEEELTRFQGSAVLGRSKLHDALYTCCRSGNVQSLMKINEFLKSKDWNLLDGILTLEEYEQGDVLALDETFLYEPVGQKQKTLLHVAAEHCQKDTVWWLLSHGFDPSIVSITKEVPYISAPDKLTRNQFRKFRSQYPDMYDYEKAQIPSPLSDEVLKERKEKVDKKKREQKRLKKEREQEQRRLEEEKQRFLSLSDREKRAVAAERRLLKNSSQSTVRCFQCGIDITGQVPFEYSSNLFCTTKCVRDHRNKCKL